MNQIRMKFQIFKFYQFNPKFSNLTRARGGGAIAGDYPTILRRSCLAWEHTSGTALRDLDRVLQPLRSPLRSCRNLIQNQDFGRRKIEF